MLDLLSPSDFRAVSRGLLGTLSSSRHNVIVQRTGTDSLDAGLRATYSCVLTPAEECFSVTDGFILETMLSQTQLCLRHTRNQSLGVFLYLKVFDISFILDIWS